MRTMIISMLLIWMGLVGKGQQFTPVSDKSTIKFTIKNFGFGVAGSFETMGGVIHFNPLAPADDSFNITVESASINTDNVTRDNHLRENDYFDVKNYSFIRFVSSAVQPSNKTGNYTMTASLQIKNKTKIISFPFSATPTPEGYLFNGSFRINRRDFGIGGSSTLSDNVEVLLSVFAKKS